MKSAIEHNASNNNVVAVSSKILYYGLLFVFVLEYARIGHYINIIDAVKLNVIVPVSVFLFSLFSNQKNSSIHNADDINLKLILFLLLLNVISTQTSDHPLFSQNILSTCIGYAFLFYIIKKNSNTFNRIKGVFFTIILCHLFVIIMNIEVISNPNTRTYIQNNPFMGDGNDFALSLCISLPLSLFLLNSTNKKINKICITLISLVLILAIIGTQSRGASLALLSILIYLGIKNKNKLRYSFCTILIILLVFIYAPPAYFSRLENVNNWQEASAQGRVDAWKAAFEMAKDHPFLGVGAGHFPEKYASEYQIGEKYVERKTAHSMYFLALGELGFPGFFFIISFVTINFFKNENLIKKIQVSNKGSCHQEVLNLIVLVNASLTGFSVAGAFLSVLYYPHLFVLAGIHDSVRRIAEDHLAGIEKS